MEAKVLASLAAAWCTWMSYAIANRCYRMVSVEWKFLAWQIVLYSIIMLGIWG